MSNSRLERVEQVAGGVLGLLSLGFGLGVDLFGVLGLDALEQLELEVPIPLPNLLLLGRIRGLGFGVCDLVLDLDGVLPAVRLHAKPAALVFAGERLVGRGFAGELAVGLVPQRHRFFPQLVEVAVADLFKRVLPDLLLGGLTDDPAARDPAADQGEQGG